MKKATEQCWSDLSLDILENIFKHLPPLEQLRFRIVCRAWYRATTAVRTNPTPWIVIFHHCNFNGKRRACGLQHLFVLDADGGGRFSAFSIPKDFEGWRCSGSSHGWLFLWSGKHSALLNRLTGSSVVLPDLRGCSRRKVIKVILSSSPTFSGHYLVAVLFSVNPLYQRIAFWKPGEKHWLWKYEEVIGDVENIVFSYSKTCVFILGGYGSWSAVTPCFSDKTIRFLKDCLCRGSELAHLELNLLLEMENQEIMMDYHYAKDVA